MANKVTYGLKNVHYAMRLDDDSSGAPVWETPVALPGAVSFKPSPEGDEYKKYADDGIYFTATTNNGYTADLDMTDIPPAVLAEWLNWGTDSNGALVEDADALPAPFALMFEVTGDSASRRKVFYECRAARPGREEKTKEAAIEATDDVLTLTITPITIGDRSTPSAMLELSDSNTAAYGAFFDSVYVEVPAA